AAMSAAQKAKADAAKAKAEADRRAARLQQLATTLAKYDRKAEDPLGQFSTQLGLDESKLRKDGFGDDQVARLYYSALPQQTFLEGNAFERLSGTRTVASIQ